MSENLNPIAEKAADLAVDELAGRVPPPDWDDAYEGAIQALKLSESHVDLNQFSQFCSFGMDCNEYAVYYDDPKYYYDSEIYHKIDEIDYNKPIWSCRVLLITPTGSIFAIFAISNNPQKLLEWALDAALKYSE